MRYVNVASQFQALYGTPKTSLYSGELGRWYSTIMAADTLDAEMISLRCAPDAYIVDLMCGDGRILRWLAGHGHRGVGVDLSASAIERATSLGSDGIEFVVDDAFNWTPRMAASMVILGGLASSMFTEERLLALFQHVGTYMAAGAELWTDYLPEYAGDPGWRGDFVLPVSQNGFVVSSTVRDPVTRSQESSFFFLGTDGADCREYASHRLVIHGRGRVEAMLIEAGFNIASAHDSYQFDPGGFDESLPSWPIRKVRAVR